MANAFSAREKKIIEEKLFDSARECLKTYGVKKTTIDQIALMSGISKGSFYKFYPGKEVLFFKVMENYQKEMMNDLKHKLRAADPVGPAQFTEIVFDLYTTLGRSFVMTIFKNREIDILIRKLPEEMLKNHHSMDNVIMDEILSGIHLKDNVNTESVSAALRAVTMSMLHIEEIGETQYEDGLKLLIRGLGEQMIEER